MICAGTKRDGTRCTRNASEGSEYCFQHINGVFNKVTFFLADILGVKRRFLLWLLLFSIILFFIEGYANHRYNQILDDIKLEPSLEVEVSPFLYNAPFGDYLPLIVTNTGDFTFKDVHIFINSCEMPNKIYEHYSLPLIPAHSERMVPFGNKNVTIAFKKGNCYPFSGAERSYASFSFELSEILQGKNYTTTSTGCGGCYFDAKIFANYTYKNKNQNFRKNISSYFSFPVDLTFTIGAP